MRVIAMIRANADSESGKMPSDQVLEEMDAFNAEMVAAGVMITGEGLYSTAKGARIILDGTNVSAVHGPFKDIETIIAGYWILQVNTLDEAITWMKRVPNPDRVPAQIEIRQIASMEDFVADFAPEQ